MKNLTALKENPFPLGEGQNTGNINETKQSI